MLIANPIYGAVFKYLTDNPDIAKDMLRRLDLEEMAQREYENAFGAMERKMAKQEEILTENKKALEEKDKLIKDLLQKLENK